MLLSKKEAFQNADWINQRFRNNLGSYPWKLHKEVKFLIAFSTETKDNKKYRLKQVKVLPLKHNDIQYSASIQFCSGSYSSEVVDLFITLSAINH